MEKLLRAKYNLEIYPKDELAIAKNEIEEINKIQEVQKIECLNKQLEEQEKYIRQQEKWNKIAEEDRIVNKTLTRIGPKFFNDKDIINTSGQTWKVIKYTNDELIIEVMGTSGRIKTYLDIGKQYHLTEHPNRKYKYELWEIPAEQMKRSDSQLLLYICDDLGPSIDLDS